MKHGSTEVTQRNLLHHEIEIMRGVGHRKLVVIVDEGHLLSKEMLEEIRFLLNYKMDSENPSHSFWLARRSYGRNYGCKRTERSSTGLIFSAF